MVRVRNVEWAKVPLVPVTVMLYLPDAVEAKVVTFKVEVPEPPKESGRRPGLKENVGPEGDELAESETVPEKPVLFRAMVVVPDEPAGTPRLMGLAEMAKFPVTTMITLTDRASVPLLPVTVML